MPAVARMSGTDTVSCTDGAKGSPCGKNVWHWNTPTTQATASGSGDVFINGIGAVREGDVMKTHPDGNPCTGGPIPHAPALSTYSPNVFVNGKALGRVGDKFDSDGHYSHSISSGSPDVIAN
jgi:uncharacterized Zn-binding protein involved in type VI secretion